jgi:hypothetical protein
MQLARIKVQRQVHQVLDLARRQAGRAHVVDLELEHVGRASWLRGSAAKRSHTVARP